MIEPTRIIETAHLFPELDGLLIDLLESLSHAQWRARTIVPRWTVHQIAAHLLDTALRRLSMCRDGWMVAANPMRSERDLLDRVNRLNAEGVELYGRLSPALLVSLTKATVPQLAHYVGTLDPMAPAQWAVSWAGETISPNWFDVAREFTERWHHQQQIRLAVGRPGILTPRLYVPVLDTFMRALPRAYEGVEARTGTVCRVVVTGQSGGTWHVVRRAEVWTLDAGVKLDEDDVMSTTRIAEDAAWRVFTKGLSPAEAHAHVTIEGDDRLGRVVLRALAIVG
jgi:uncharacterized protein (TIGR03083 family)